MEVSLTNNPIANPLLCAGKANAMNDAEEGEARELLRKGIPLNVPACDYHRKLRSYPSLRIVIETSVIEGGAFFPLCTHCQTKPVVQAHLDILFARPAIPDLCSCASSTVRSKCWYCSLTFWELDKTMAEHERKQELQHNSAEPTIRPMACGCGRVVQKPYQVTQCVSCKGVATTFDRKAIDSHVEYQSFRETTASYTYLSAEPSDPHHPSVQQEATPQSTDSLFDGVEGAVKITKTGDLCQGLEGATELISRQKASVTGQQPLLEQQQASTGDIRAIIAALGTETVRPKLCLDTDL